MLYANLYQSGDTQWLGDGFATRADADLSASLTQAKRIAVARIVNRPNVPIQIKAPQPVWVKEGR